MTSPFPWDRDEEPGEWLGGDAWPEESGVGDEWEPWGWDEEAAAEIDPLLRRLIQDRDDNLT